MIFLGLENEISPDFKIQGTPGVYAEGPFNINRSDREESVLGVDITQSGPTITVWDGSSGITLTSEEFEGSVSEDGRTITFTPKDDEGVTITLTPASVDDLKESFSYLNFSSDEEAWTVAGGLIRRTAGEAYGVYTGGKLTDLGIVLEDNSDQILGMYLFNTDGSFKRENGAWVAIESDDEEAEAELEEGSWIETLEGSVAVYDENENADKLSLDQFDGYTL